MTHYHLFYTAGIIALAISIIFVLEIGITFYRMRKPQRMNSYLSERERQQAADQLLHALYPTSKQGPKGFAAQNDRRITQFKKVK